MPPTPIITETPSHHLHIRPLYIALVTPFIIAGLAYAFIPSLRDGLGMLLSPVEEPMITEMPAAEKPEVLGGSISLSLAKPGGPAGVYTYSIEANAMESVAVSEELEYFGAQLSPDGSRIAISSAPEDGPVTQWVGSSDLSDLEEIKTEDTLITLQATSWARDGSKVALVGKEMGNASTDVDAFTVYTYDVATGVTKFITNGTNARFTPLGTLLVLKTDGIHHIDLTTGDDVVVISADEEGASNSMTLALSGDGSRLAWSNPQQSKVLVFNIESYSPFTHGVESVLDISTADIAVSPKGDYIAGIEYALSETQEGATTTIATLATYTIDGQNMSALADVTHYMDGFTRINYWR